jgi:hypothetical protein
MIGATMKRLILVALVATLAALAITPTVAAASAGTCSIASIAKPDLPGGPVGVHDRMVGKCFTTIPDGFQLVLGMQYEMGGQWYDADPNYPNETSGQFVSGTEGAFQYTWTNVDPVCAVNWRGEGTWRDYVTGAVIVSKYSLTLAKTC